MRGSVEAIHVQGKTHEEQQMAEIRRRWPRDEARRRAALKVLAGLN